MSLRQAAKQIIAWYAEGQHPTGDDIVDTLREALAQPESLRIALDHYEQALKASWPEGAKGEAFTHWNEARKALSQQDRKCEADPYAELKAAARDPTKQVRLRGSEIWVEGDFYVFDEPPENYEIRNKPLADPMQNLKMAEES